jgi:hypothetical protein
VRTVEAWSEVHNGEEIEVPFVGHMVPLLAEDHRGYLCHFP